MFTLSPAYVKGVFHVYVENTFHVSRDRRWSISIRATTRSRSGTRAANLAEAKQSVLAARQDYELCLADLNAAVATNVKAGLEDVKRYRELLDQGVIAREPTMQWSGTERSPRPLSTRTVRRSPQRQN